MARTAAGTTPADHAGPSRVRGGRHTGDGVGQQDGRAVGGEDGEREPSPRRDDRVDGGDLRGAPGLLDDRHVRPVHLVHPDDPGRVEPECLGGEFPVGAYGVGVVADRPAEVELLVRNGAHPAPPVGEGEVGAAHGARGGALSYHFRKSGTSSSSAALSE